jgi:queuosine precursor transporter
MLSDIASLKIGVVFGLAVDMGTFIYPLTFTLRDMVHKLLGKQNAQILIVSAGAINLLMAGYLFG